MNFGLIVVSDKDAANKIISEHGGKITGSFTDTLNILKD